MNCAPRHSLPTTDDRGRSSESITRGDIRLRCGQSRHTRSTAWRAPRSRSLWTCDRLDHSDSSERRCPCRRSTGSTAAAGHKQKQNDIDHFQKKYLTLIADGSVSLGASASSISTLAAEGVGVDGNSIFVWICTASGSGESGESAGDASLSASSSLGASSISI